MRLIDADAIENELGVEDRDLYVQHILDSAPTIEINLQELEDRYGKEVRFVVEDMISGEGKRWKNEMRLLQIQ